MTCQTFSRGEILIAGKALGSMHLHSTHKSVAALAVYGLFKSPLNDAKHLSAW